MGLFTTVTDKNKNISVQIYGGNDLFDEYLVGDKVPQEIRKSIPGEVYFDDGIYLSGCEKYWCIIQNATIIAIESRIIDESSDNYDNYQEMVDKYAFMQKAWPRNLWPEWMWKEKEIKDLKSEQEYQKFKDSISNLSPQEQLGHIFARPIREKLNYSSIARTALGIEKSLNQIIFDILKQEFPNDTVDISFGYLTNLHIMIVSRKFDNMKESVRQDYIWSLLKGLTDEEKEKIKISLIICYSPGELK